MRREWLMDHEDVDPETNRTSSIVVDAAFEVRGKLGPGLLERPYREALRHELMLRGCSVDSEVPLRAVYKGKVLDAAYRIDLVVDSRVIVEVKAIDALRPEHVAQLWTYLRCADREVGLLINFNSGRGEMIRRLANKRPSSATPANVALP